MNNRIEAAYEQRPRRWAFELAVAVVVVALLIWSGSAMETAGTTQSGATIAWNILAGIFHPAPDLLFNHTTQGVPYLLWRPFASHSWAPSWGRSSPFLWPSSPPPT